MSVSMTDHRILFFLSILIFGHSAGHTQPNFIFILTDDQDWTETSVQMHPELPYSKSQYIQTPNLEKLASEGIIFSNAYAPSSVCAPTRISLQTGKSPAQLHWTKAGPAVTTRDNYPLIPKPIRRSIPSSETTIAEILKDAGYATAHYGKWHLSGGGPEEHGYDESDGNTGNQDAARHVAPNPVDIFGITERASAFMEKHAKASTPFFMQLSHNGLHYPENSTPEMLLKYAKLTGRSTDDRLVQRCAMAEHLDQGLGLIMEKIDALGIRENTYLIFMSDNGGTAGGKRDRRKNTTNTRPLNSGKGSVFEGGIRIPLIIRGPEVPADIYSNSRVVGYDLFTTFCSLAGIKQPLPEGIEGGDMTAILHSGKGQVQRPREALVFHFPHYQADTPHSAILLGDYKLIKWYEDSSVKLFNLSKDIGESKDLSEQFPEKTAELLKALEQYLKDMDAQIPDINPDYDPSKPSTPQQGKKPGGQNNRKGQSR